MDIKQTVFQLPEEHKEWFKESVHTITAHEASMYMFSKNLHSERKHLWEKLSKIHNLDNSTMHNVNWETGEITVKEEV